MCKNTDLPTIRPVPTPPPLPSKVQAVEEDANKRISKKNSKLSSMLPRRLSDESMKKKKEGKQKSKSKHLEEGSVTSIAKRSSSDQSLKKKRNKSKSADASDPFLPKRLSDSSIKKGRRSRGSSKDPEDPFLPKRLSDGSMKKKNEKPKRKSSAKPRDDPVLSKRLGRKKKSKSLDGLSDMKKSLKASKKIVRKTASFSGELTDKNVSRNDSNGSSRSSDSDGSARSRRSIDSDGSTRSRRSSLTGDNFRLPNRTLASSRAKKTADTKAIMDSLVNSLVPAKATLARRVSFDDSVQCRTIDNSKSDHNAIWFSRLEIMEHRKREETANRQARNELEADLQGLFTIKERNTQSARKLQAFEAVFDMQMIHKKEKELEAAVGIFRCGLHQEAHEADYEDSMAAEYMQVTAPATESAVLRAANLQVHVELLWDESSSEAARKAARRDSAPSVPKRKVSNRITAKACC